MEIIEFKTVSKEGVLLDYNIEALKRMFDTKESYAYYMKSLWILRSLVFKTTGVNEQHELFPLFDVSNRLVGALLSKDVYFDEKGNMHEY